MKFFPLSIVLHDEALAILLQNKEPTKLGPAFTSGMMMMLWTKFLKFQFFHKVFLSKK